MANQNVWTPAKLEAARKELDELYRRNPMTGRPPLAGVEASIGCLKCRKPFGMRLGEIEPVRHRNGTVGFLCRACVEELNRWRAFLKLSPLPLNAPGYVDLGPPDPPVHSRLTREEWSTTEDARELLRHAATRVPRRHLGLVLAAIAEEVHSNWLSRWPGDWRVALGIATVRGWCLGEVTEAELKHVQKCLFDAAWATSIRDAPAAFYAAGAVQMALTAAIDPTPVAADGPALVARESLPKVATSAAGVAHAAATSRACASGLAEKSEMALKGPLLAFANLVRRLVPFPTTPSERWEVEPGLIICGEAALSMNGWVLRDAVALSEFTSLTAERAVAFDAAQLLPRDELERMLAPAPVVEKTITPVKEPQVDPDLRRQLGDALREEFKHRRRDGQICAKCGAADRPLAAHVAVFLDGNPGLEPRSWVPQATSYAPDRGGPAVCDRCAPPCRKCELPVVEGSTARWLKALPGVRAANGRCTEHFRIFGLTF